MTDSHPATTPEALLRQAGFLRALAQGLLGDEHASEDVVQETWLAALERDRDELRTPRAWLARVTRNLALKRRRGENRREARERAAARPEALAPASESSEHADTLRLVTDAVLALDEPYRSTILLRYFEGLELSEIATRRREPLATVRSRHTRALAQLRERLDHAHGGDRAAWSLGLVALVGGERLGLVGTGVGSVTSVTTGALIVTTKLKLAALALAVVGLTALWLGSGSLFGDRSTRVVAATPAPGLVAPRPEASATTRALTGPDRAHERSAAEPAALEAVATRGSLLVSAAWPDGTPAAGVVVKAHPWGAPDPFLESFYARVDERGEVRLEGLAPGLVGVYVDRGGFVSAQVEAGSQARAEITLREGLEVSGRVVDLRGISVPDAEIWLSDLGNGRQGVAVASSDANGRFVLRDVSDQNSVGAHKAGFAPSPSFWIEGSPGDSRELELILQGTGAALAVRVVDPHGEPVAGARVHVEEQGHQQEGYGPDVAVQRAIPYMLPTDAEGTCLAASLLPGKAEVVVGASGLAPWSGIVELAAGATEVLEVTLLEGAVLGGIVRSPDGDPLEGVTVRVGGYADLASREVRSGPDGRYRLIGLAPGELSATASLRGSGQDAATLGAADGAQLEWNPVIDPGLVLRGRLVDQRGAALAGWMVNVGAGGKGWDGPSSFSGQTFTDAGGRFRVVNCPEQPLWLQAIEAPLRTLYPELELEGLRAGTEEHLLEVADTQRASGWIKGRVLGTDGRPTSVELTLRRADRDRRHSLWSDVDTGAFRIGPLAPGTYAVSALGRDGASQHRDDLLLIAEATLDLGTLQMGGPGRVQIVVDAAEGIDPDRVQLMILSDERRGVRSLPASEAAEAIELPAGRYLLESYGSVVPESVAFSVAPDETTVVELAPRAGVRVTLHFQLPAGVDLPLELELVFRPEGGGEPWETSAYLMHEEGLPFEYSTYAVRTLPPATGYTLEVRGPDGLRGSAVLGPGELQPGAEATTPPVEVVLR